MSLETYDWKTPFLLEMKTAEIVSLQARHGTQFKKRQAQWYIYSLTERIVDVDKVVIPLLPKMMNKGTEYKKPFVLSGKFAKWPGEYAERVGLKREEVGGPFTAVWYTDFDPGKTDRVKRLMLDLGWTPTEWNSKKIPVQVHSYRRKLERSTWNNFIESVSAADQAQYNALVNSFIDTHFRNKTKCYMKTMLNAIGFKGGKIPTFAEIKKRLLLTQAWPTSPKITEDSFDSIDESQGLTLKLLKERMVWSHRRSLLRGLVELTRDDGKVEGRLNPCATPTARGRHRGIVNIPAAYATFGRECRSLFTGDSRPDAKPLVLRKAIKEGMRVKPNTNILQVWSEKKERWEDDGLWRDYIPRGHDSFVGGDGAGLELRMLTHYMIAISKSLLQEATEVNDEHNKRKYTLALEAAYEYREQLLFGDIHSHNQRLAGLDTRNDAKRFIYSFLYGAGDGNLGSQLGGGKELGLELRTRFLQQCPCIPVLIQWVQDFAEKHGWVPAIDGRKLLMRREEDGKVSVRRALNTLLQAAGSIVMKYGMCFLHQWVKRDNIRCNQVIFYHDEFQYTCHTEDVVKLRGLVDACIKRAGEFLKMECPLASDSLHGSSWFATH